MVVKSLSELDDILNNIYDFKADEYLLGESNSKSIFRTSEILYLNILDYSLKCDVDELKDLSVYAVKIASDILKLIKRRNERNIKMKEKQVQHLEKHLKY